MDNVICSQSNDNYILNFKGHIDSANAPTVEEFINSKKDEFAGKKLIINASQLEYISSAGLRIILRHLKDHPELKIVEVPKDVYDVFQMTGFTDMLPIEKAFRKISIEAAKSLVKAQTVLFIASILTPLLRFIEIKIVYLISNVKLI